MHRALLLSALCLITSGSATAWQDCLPAPIVSASHAVCVAKAFVETPESRWRTRYVAEDADMSWRVTYRPESSNVRGGSGKLSIDKKSGKVLVVEAER